MRLDVVAAAPQTGLLVVMAVAGTVLVGLIGARAVARR
jgi:hypothetical protein